MDENLLGYLLDALDGPARREIELQLQADPALQAKLLRIKQAIRPLAYDAEPASPPLDLVLRTLTKVSEHICSDHFRQPVEHDLPHSPILRYEAGSSSRSWWHRVDVLVAACLILTTFGALIPAIVHLRSASGDGAILACQNNLREFYHGLQIYRDQHGQFPNVTAEGDRNVAGMVVPILDNAGTLPRTASTRCPGVGSHVGCEVSLEALRAMTAEQFAEQSPKLSKSYAYSLGYRDEDGSYHAPGTNPVLMGDRVFGDDPHSNSSNHDGKGQNILFSDGHVSFCTTRTIADDDLYLNRANVVAAGVGALDAVLGSSASRP